MVDDATRMRDGGQSWTKIAETLGVSVAEAKARVQADKRARREGLARTPEAEDRNGLRDLCADCDPKCSTGSMRKSHEQFTGECQGCSCNEYVYIKRYIGLPWYRLPKDTDPHYIDPDTQLHDGVAIQARQLGVPVRVRRPPTEEELARQPRYFRQRGATVPQPRLETLARRARKKLKKGKKLKRHYDAPKKDQRWF